MSKRQTDVNGYLLVRDNPITKVGVFPYLGREIGAPDPDRIYQVYRPQEELEKPETIASANLVPWIDEHEFLGKDGTPPEKKGVQGTTGETARFDYPYIRNSIRAYSGFMQNLIDRGKVELSPSYRCRYEFSEGVFDGKRYDAIQRDIRFNHLASVKEGRTGPDVAVQDCLTITYDSAEFIKMELTPEILEQIRALIEQVLADKAAAAGSDNDPEKKPGADADPPAAAGAVTPEAQSAVEQTAAAAEEATSAVESAQAAIQEVQTALEEVEAAAEEVKAAPTADSRKALDAALAKLGAVKNKISARAADAQVSGLIKGLQAQVKANDASAVVRQLAERDALVKRVTPFIGAFDSALLVSADHVAQYAVKKLGLKAPDGAELAVLDGFLQAAKSDADKIVSDSKTVRAEDTAAKLWSDKK
ncbi:hypothetical protein LMG3482_01904 [Achromobacter deleyi]|uniref:DUF2213 domain-containing protein n=1 Tax=Achromobacter deleyi TaxID=1353891 RepID=UPI001468297F|nr:DUF2213 domain-containing protein [Achromobacter deleyi]CAB3846638.1 hypothetical protein LMG3481_01541 [Achromobacter deleyi]CAB3853717.1 hypothetical protein LMG3482_01904 [Achromobacter deleyi]